MSPKTDQSESLRKVMDMAMAVIVTYCNYLLLHYMELHPRWDPMRVRQR